MDKDQLRIVKRELRQSHQKLFAVQGRAIDALFEVLEAIRETQNEMVKLFEADDELDEATKE